MKDKINRNKAGQLHGAYESYYDNGHLWIKTTYDNDQLHGKYEFYRENGNLWEKTVYKNGVEVKKRGIK